MITITYMITIDIRGSKIKNVHNIFTKNFSEI